MATLPRQETPAETMLRIERQNIAAMGEATPTPVTGPLTTRPDLPSGFAADLTGRIFRAPANLAPASAPSPSAPSPAAPSATTNTTPPAPVMKEPTAGQVYGNYAPSNDPELDAAYAAQKQTILETQKPFDENAIREQTLRRFQAEIDAMNQYYNETKRQKLAREAPIAEGRLGTNAAISARRGLVGSTFGEAQNQKIVDYNAEVANAIERAVDAERNQAIQEILGKARTESQKEIDAKVAAKVKGAQDYIDFLKGAAERKDARVGSAVANLIASGQTPDEAAYKALADQLGIDVETFKTRYLNAKKTAEAEVVKNAKFETVAPGSSLYRNGVLVGTAPSKPADNKPVIEKFADDTTRQWNPATNTWDILASGSEKPGAGIVGEYQFYEAREKAAGRTPMSFTEYQNEDANRKRSSSSSSYRTVAPGSSLYKDGVLVGTAPLKPTTGAPKVVRFADDTTRQWDEGSQTWIIVGAGSDAPSDILNNQPPTTPKLNKTISDVEQLQRRSLGDEQRTKVRDILTENPNATPEQINQILGFSKESQTSLKGATQNTSGLVAKNRVASKVIASATGTYDFTNYATDPNWGRAVRTHLSRTPDFESAQEITQFIRSQAPRSPITGEMVLASAQRFNVDPRLIVAIAKQEANYATLGRAAYTYNPGNVGNVDSGANVNWGSWQRGMDALARNISRRRLV